MANYWSEVDEPGAPCYTQKQGRYRDYGVIWKQTSKQKNTGANLKWFPLAKDGRVWTWNRETTTNKQIKEEKKRITTTMN